MGRPSRFSPEVRERAVRMVEEHREAHASEWAVLQSVAPKFGCTAYVFGSAPGEYQANIQTAWETLRLLANGHEPRRERTGRRGTVNGSRKSTYAGMISGMREPADCSQTVST
jgi:hypothetical protein